MKFNKKLFNSYKYKYTKFLYILSYLFNIQIEVPKKELNYTKKQFYKDNRLDIEYIEKIEKKLVDMKSDFQMIIDLAYDYDGYNKAENLKELIDELVIYAKKGLEE